MQKLFAKSHGDQNFIGALILVVIAVTIGIMYRKGMSDILTAAVKKVGDTVKQMFDSVGTTGNLDGSWTGDAV